MDGIEKIEKRITSDVNAEIAALEKETADKISEIENQYKSKVNAILADAEKKSEASYAARKERLAGSAEMERKQLLLQTKQRLLDEAFANAKTQLMSMKEDDYVNLLASLASKNGTGKEEIIFSAKDAAIGEKVVAKANQLKKDGAFTLSKETRDFEGGLILKDGFVEINCSFDSQLHALRQDMATEIAKILFD